MIRLIFSLFLIPIFIFASTIDTKIAQNQKILDSSKKNKDNTTVSKMDSKQQSQTQIYQNLKKIL